MEYPTTNVEIKRIASFDKKKDGSPYTTKAGKPFKKVLIDVDSDCIDDIEFTGSMSMLDFDGLTDDWSEGTKITGKIIHDGDYWNFELPRVTAKDRIAELEKENEMLKATIEEMEKVTGKDEDLEGLDEIPF